MEKLEKMDLKILEKDFLKALNISQDIFGNDAFRKRIDENHSRKPLNKAYFEVITVFFSKLNDIEIKKLKENKEIFKKNLISLMKNSRYSNSLSGGTGTKDSVNIRFSWFKTVLDKSLLGKLINITDDNKIEDSEF